jgi:hypothetical protein
MIKYYKAMSAIRNKELLDMKNNSNNAIKNSFNRSKHLVNSLLMTNKVKEKEGKKFISDCAKKEFDRPIMMKLKHDNFFAMDDSRSNTNSTNGRLGKHIEVDLKHMTKKAKKKYYLNQMKNLEKCGLWLIMVLHRLTEYFKRTKHPIRICCLKYLGVIWQLALHGWSITIPLFYKIVEHTIPSDEHKDMIVHRALNATRDFLRIDDEIFLLYLEKNGIQPCSELLSHVHSLRVKRIRKQRVAFLGKQLSTAGEAGMTGLTPNPPGSAPTMRSMMHRSNTYQIGNERNYRPNTLGIIDNGNSLEGFVEFIQANRTTLNDNDDGSDPDLWDTDESEGENEIAK